LKPTTQAARYSVKACSHRRHGQDKTVLSCPHRRWEHDWRQDKTILSAMWTS